jgi:hypothetical protein
VWFVRARTGLNGRSSSSDRPQDALVGRRRDPGTASSGSVYAFRVNSASTPSKQKLIERVFNTNGRRKRQRLGTSTCPADRLRAERPNHVWALDFQFDQTSDGKILKLLNIVDEHSREEPWGNVMGGRPLRCSQPTVQLRLSG